MSKAHTGMHYSPETKEKDRQNQLGKHHTSETIEKIRAKNIGRKHTSVSRRKMRENHADNSSEKHYLYGKHIPLETRRKMSEAKLGDKNSMKRPEVRAKMSNTLIEGIISGRIRTKNRAKYGYVFSAKMNKSIYVESSYEARAVKMFDEDSVILSFIKSPCRILYQFEGKDHYYIPDFETVDACGHRTLVETLAAFTLTDLQRQAKLEAGRKFAENGGMGFCVLTGDDLPKDAPVYISKEAVCTTRMVA